MKMKQMSLSVDVVKVTDESLHRRFTTQLVAERESEEHVLDITNDTQNLPSTSSDAVSMSYGSPFAPNIRGIKELLGEKPVTPSETSKVLYHFHNRQYSLNKHALQELDLKKKAAPEKILTLFAMRLALLEKLATTVGKLTFVWATVVLLGGFATTLKILDFWFVTLILVTEGARIFGRSHELEWQHQNPGKNTISHAYQKGSDAIHRSMHAVGTVFSHLLTTQDRQTNNPHKDRSRYLHQPHLARAWSSSNVSLIPFMWRIFKAKHVSAILYFMQILSAVLSIVISVWRLFRSHEYDYMDETETSGNLKAALIMFYGLTIFEALVFLIERAYWQYKVSVENILHTVSHSCKLTLDEDCYTVRRFFYDVYAKCLTDSVFEGLKMDLVDYSLQWLQSDVHVEQLHGVRALFAFSCHPDSGQETLRTIGTRQGAVERLLEMVTWKNEEEQDIREAAASLLCELVGYDRTRIRVTALAGSIEAIFTLLTDDRSEDPWSCNAHEFTNTEIVSQPDDSPSIGNHIVQIGLMVLINMAKNTINCGRIGSTRGLLTRLISFIDANKLRGSNGIEQGHEETVRFLSLELLSLLAACPGASGKILRQDIANNLVSVTNLRNILNSKEGGYHLQELAAGTLSSLAMDAQVREVIGRTGGIMCSLFSLFLIDAKGKNVSKEEMMVAIKAGEALTLLALQDSDNCGRMLRLRLEGDRPEGEELIQASRNDLTASSRGVHVRHSKDVVDVLMEMMGDCHRGHLAIFLLHCFCNNNIEWIHKMRIAAASSQVMRLAMTEDERVQDAAIGLAARTLSLLAAEEVERVFSDGEFTKEGVAMMIVRKLEANRKPHMRLPWVRRVCLELVAALIDCDPASFWGLFAKSERFITCLDNVAATSSEVENYATFSGAIGVALHFLTMEQLIQILIDKLQLQHRTSSS